MGTTDERSSSEASQQHTRHRNTGLTAADEVPAMEEGEEQTEEEVTCGKRDQEGWEFLPGRRKRGGSDGVGRGRRGRKGAAPAARPLYASSSSSSSGSSSPSGSSPSSS